MSEGSVFQRKDGKWCGKYKDANGKWKYLYRKTKVEAKKALRQALKDRDDGIIPADKITLSHALDSYLDNMRDAVSERSYLSSETLVRLHIKPNPISAVSLVALNSDQLRLFYRQKAKQGTSASILNRVHKLLNRVFKEALIRKQIRSNPIPEVRPPKLQKRDMEVLTPDQLKRLLEVVRGHRFECIFILGALCGLRSGEAHALRWEDVDLDHGTIRIRRTLWRNKTYPPKTASSNRTLTLPTLALEALTRHADKNDQNNEGWMFPTRNGNPVAAPNFWRCDWKPALRQAGIPETFTFHSLRHGAASLMLGQKVPVPIVSKYLGHRNPGITMTLYAHVINGTGGQASDAIDSALG